MFVCPAHPPERVGKAKPPGSLFSSLSVLIPSSALHYDRTMHAVTRRTSRRGAGLRLGLLTLPEPL